MDFSWGHAAQIALIGFSGVFIILIILLISVNITSRLVRLFQPKPYVAKKESK